VERIRNLMESVSPGGDIDRETNTKFRIGGTMLMFTVMENEVVNIWMYSYKGGYSVNIWIKSVYLLADVRYNKAVKELLSKYTYEAYKDLAEIEARPLSERFVYVGYADNELPKDSWARIWFGEAGNAENGENDEKTAEKVSVGRVVDSGRGEVRFVEADGSTGIGTDGEPLVEKYDLGIAFGSSGSLAAHERLNARLSDTQLKALA
jgi:hypothetical protein